MKPEPNILFPSEPSFSSLPSLKQSLSDAPLIILPPAAQPVRRPGGKPAVVVRQSFCPSQVVVKSCHLREAWMPSQKAKNSRPHIGNYSLLKAIQAFPEFFHASSLIIAFPGSIPISGPGRGENSYPWFSNALLKTEINKASQ